MDKAICQPDNHICLTEYTAKERTIDVKLYRGKVPAIDSTAEESTPEPPIDSFMLAAVGILEEMREQDDIAAWLRDGGLRVTGEGRESTHRPTVMWFDDPGVLEYWVQRGRTTLQALQIPIEVGIITR